MGISGELLELLDKRRGTTIVAMSPTGELDVVELDVTNSQTIEWPGQVTDNPVEGGESYAHSIYRSPLAAQIEGMLTDNPVEMIAGVQPDATAAAKLAKLIELRDREEPVWVIVSMMPLLGLGIEHVAAAKDVDLGDGIAVSIGFKRLNIVTAATVPSQFDVDAFTVGAGGVAEVGTVATIDPFAYTPPVVAF